MRSERGLLDQHEDTWTEGLPRRSTSQGLVLVLAFVLGVGMVTALPWPSLVASWQPWPTLPTPSRGFRWEPEARVDALRVVALPFTTEPVESDGQPAPTWAARVEEPVVALLPPALTFLLPPASDRDDARDEGLGAPSDPRLAQTSAPHAAERLALARALRPVVAALGEPPSPIEMPCSAGRPGACHGAALDQFFAQWLQTGLRRQGAVTRMSVFGDSLVASDHFTGELRQLLQAQFGDGGHGFLYAGVPDRAVGSQGVMVAASDQWAVRSVVRHSGRDSAFGLGGVSFDPDGRPTLRVVREVAGEPGIERVAFLYRSRGASTPAWILQADGSRLDARDEREARDGVFWFDLPAATRDLRVNHFPPGTRAYGVVVERRGPGFVVDNLGLVSSRESRLERIDAAEWSRQAQGRDTHLLTFFYGANVAGDHLQAAVMQERYRQEVLSVYQRAQSIPGRDCLVVSILTRGERTAGGIRTVGAVRVVHDAQRQAALEAGCAFWSAFESIGGDESAARWQSARPQLLAADLSHPTRAGYRELGRLFYQALLHAFVAWLERP